jgi:aminoglycoside 3-N-acetyltransferase I
MSGFTVRRLGPTDVAAARGINALFADAFEEPERYAGALPADAWIAGLLARPDYIALVAEADGAVVGGLTAYTLPKLEQAISELYLYDIAVAETHRRRGIATALIRDLQALARRRGAATVYVQADPEDAPAVALYERLGSRAEVLHFDLPPGTD